MKKVIILLIAVLILSCSQQNYSNKYNLDGIWLQNGYGVLLEVNDSVFRMYDLCTVSCTPVTEDSVVNFDEYAVIVENTASTLTLKSGITEYDFTRLDKMPDLCNTNLSDLQQDPTLNFETLWHTLNEHYAYFELRKIDWNEMHTEYESRISEESSPYELYSVLKEMLDSIGDRHITFNVPDSISEYTASKKESNQPKINYSELQEKAKSSITDHYITGQLRTMHDGLAKWGFINDTLGYIQINRMYGFSNEIQFPEDSIDTDFWNYYWKQVAIKTNDFKFWEEYIEEEKEGTRIIMDSIVSDLQSTESIILDLRFNGGGFDDVAIEILNHFTSKKVKAFTKKAKQGDGYTRLQEIYLNPSHRNYEGKLILLTSHLSASATEILVLSSLALPNVVRIGSNTMGIFSDMLMKKLPNGWTYTISNEVYESLDFKNYENTGIPPHILIEYQKDKEIFYKRLTLLGEVDPAIEIALSN